MEEIVQMRSALFVPGSHPDRVDKAVQTHADIVIIDLEDAVSISEKPRARECAREKVSRHSSRRMMVRINAFDTGLIEYDLEQIVVSGLDAIMLPKVQTPEDVERINQQLQEYEKAAGCSVDSIQLIGLIESALGVENAFHIATASHQFSRYFTLAFGAADFCNDMGIALSKTGDEQAYARARIATGCAAAGLDAPLDTPFMADLKDREAFEADVLKGKRAGFGGKLCIHPNQVDFVNETYSPTEAEIKYAEKVYAAFQEAESNGQAAILVDGKFVDKPIVAHSIKILKTAKHIRNH